MDTVRGRIERAREKFRLALARTGLALPAVFPVGLGLTREALTPLQAAQIARTAAQWSSGAAAAGGSAAAIGAASHLLRGMHASALLTNLTAAAVLITALIGGAWVLPIPDAAADATRTEPPQVRTAVALPQPETSAPEAPIRARAVPAAEVELNQPEAKEPAAVEEGIGNLLQVLEVSINKLEAKATAQALSKLYNVNIYFSDAALETIDDQKIVLRTTELNGIEVLARLAKDTGTAIRVRDGAMYLCAPHEREAPAPAQEVPKAADF